MTVVLSDAMLEKAERLLLDRRVHVILPASGPVATVNGDHGCYTIHREAGTFRCTCPARSLCAHLVALSMVAA